MAFAVPRPTGDPMVIDQASSAAAKMTVRQHADEHKPIPLGWAFDADGHPTTDTSVGLAGSLAPCGGYKGAALALMVDILAAGVTGSSFTFEASSTAQALGAPPNQGQLLIAMHPAAFGGAACEARVEVLFAAMLQQEGVRLPGARRIASRV